METVNFYSREGIWMSGYIDMHCHILPEVDDGAQSIEETVQKIGRASCRERVSSPV